MRVAVLVLGSSTSETIPHFRLILFASSILYTYIQVSLPSFPSLFLLIFELGDIGRSPRMQYHAQSLSKLSSQGEKVHVDILGYEGEATLPVFSECENVAIHRIKPLTLNFLAKVRPIQSGKFL